ncbi:MAG TPA: hypothetical protein PKX55_24555, partial [Leptospiraceae bacterium]|nr:hypothetical protein [Leptospiraceae bacterium]
MKYIKYLLLVILLSTLTLFADEVTLRNEKVIEKVKVKISVDKVAVTYLDNKTETYPKKEVKS